MKTGITLALVAITVSVLATRAAEEKCSIADILFIMDESSSIWPEPFKKQKQFIKDLIDMFEVGEDGTRVGLVRFSSTARLEFPMKAYYDKDSLYGAVDRITQKGGNTNTGDALKVAREQGLTPASGGRPGNPRIPQIVIVITDGNSQETEKTKQQAALTRETGAIVFAIGVGQEISRQELDNIASGREFIYAVENYQALESIRERLGYQACNIPPTMPPELIMKGCENKKLDLAIVLDKSSDVSEENFAEMKALAQYLLFNLPVSDEYTRVSLVSYADSSKIHAYLNQGTDRTALYDQISEVKQTPGASNTAGAMKSLRSLFNPKYGARTKVAKVALFITNTKSSNNADAVSEGQNLYSKYGVEMFAVLAGSQPSVSDWQSVAGKDRVIEEERYSDLASQRLRSDLARSICPVQPPSSDYACGEKNPADIAFALDTINAGQSGLSSVNAFIRDVTNKFEIGPDKIQVSVVENDCVKLNSFDLNTYSTKPDVMAALRVDSQSNTENILNKLVSETFTEAKGARVSGVKRFAVLFVDGTPGSLAAAEQAAAKAKKENIEIFVIGIGDKVDRESLTQIASSSRHVMMVRKYAELEGNSALSGQITDAICKSESEKECR